MQTSFISCICGSRQQMVTDPESGEMVCSKCGLVSSERTVDSRAEWRTFESDGNDRTRVGSPSSLAIHDMGLATVIGKENRDSSGRQINASMNSSIQRLRTWNFRSQAHLSTHRNLIYPTHFGGSCQD